MMVFDRHAVRVGPMQYREFEQALVEMFSVDESYLSRFRARLRHLRELGVPNVPKRGSGNASTYTLAHLFTTSIALTVETLGYAPTTSVILARKAAAQLDWLPGEKRDVFLLVANYPPMTPDNLDDTSGMELGVRGFTWINEHFGGQTGAFIVVGAENAGRLVTNSKTIAVSLINLSQRLKALPKPA